MLLSGQVRLKNVQHLQYIRKKIALIAFVIPFLFSSIFSKGAYAATKEPNCVHSEVCQAQSVKISENFRVHDGGVVLSRRAQSAAFLSVPKSEKIEARLQEALERARYSFSKLQNPLRHF